MFLNFIYVIQLRRNETIFKVSQVYYTKLVLKMDFQNPLKSYSGELYNIIYIALVNSTSLVYYMKGKIENEVYKYRKLG